VTPKTALRGRPQARWIGGLKSAGHAWSGSDGYAVRMIEPLITSRERSVIAPSSGVALPVFKHVAPLHRRM
jgi:hypothetical protein